MTDAQELGELLPLLHAKTSQGRLRWHMSGSSLIVTKLGNNTVELNELDTGRIYQMVVRNENGVSLSSTVFNGNKEATEIFVQTKRAALGVDNALNDIKKQLQSL